MYRTILPGTVQNKTNFLEKKLRKYIQKKKHAKWKIFASIERQFYAMTIDEELVPSSVGIDPISRHHELSSSFRIVVFTLEFTYSPFSGNGLYARSVVKSLLFSRNNCSIRVICGKPDSRGVGLSKNNHIPNDDIDLKLWPVDIPFKAGWKRLDEHGPWKEYLTGAYQKYSTKMDEFNPHVIMVIDWHGASAFREYRKLSPLLSLKPVCYFNFRVYASSGIFDNSQWYQEKEKDALEIASDVICLSRGDQKSLQSLVNELPKNHSPSPGRALLQVYLHHPALRGDMRDLALETFQNENQHTNENNKDGKSIIPTSLNSSNRNYIACVVRLSEEKMPLLFVQVMEQISAPILSSLNIIPVLCGAASDPAYATICRDRLRKACPQSIIMDEFLGPQQLANIFSNSIINFHPCLYDAFGMTCVEAAAFGAPSIINGNHTVGATELLGNSGCIQLDLTIPIDELSNQILEIIKNPKYIQKVQKEAYKQAMCWDEDASGKIIMERLLNLASFNFATD